LFFLESINFASYVNLRIIYVFYFYWLHFYYRTTHVYYFCDVLIGKKVQDDRTIIMIWIVSGIKMLITWYGLVTGKILSNFWRKKLHRINKYVFFCRHILSLRYLLIMIYTWYMFCSIIFISWLHSVEGEIHMLSWLRLFMCKLI
jgi:hypothetical protein